MRRIEDQLAGAAHTERRLAEPGDFLLVAQIDALPPLGGSPLRLGAPALQEVAELRADDLGMLKQPLVGRAHGRARNRYDADRRAARDDGKRERASQARLAPQRQGGHALVRRRIGEPLGLHRLPYGADDADAGAHSQLPRALHEPVEPRIGRVPAGFELHHACGGVQAEKPGALPALRLAERT